MKKYLIVLLSILSISSNSQDFRVKLLFCPFALADDFSFPTIQGGIELRMTDRLAWYNEIGKKFWEGGYESSDTSFIKFSGYKVKTELRYFIKTWKNDKGTNVRGLLIGINAFYTRHIYNESINYYENEEYENEITDCFYAKKSVWGSNIIMSWQQIFAKHLVIEGFVGLGIRCRKTENFERQYDPSIHELNKYTSFTFKSVFDNININTGTNYLPNLTAGFRIGYQF
jgi:hypothetical protein